MASSYTPGSFSGGVPSGTALTNEFQKLKTALDETLQRLDTIANQMESDLDLNGNAILNVASGTNDNDVATLGDLNSAVGDPAAIATLSSAVVDLDNSVTTLETTQTGLSSSVASLNSRSQEDRRVRVLANTSATGTLSAANIGDELQAAKITLGDWVNIYWAATDSSDSSIWSAGQPLFTTGTGASLQQYELVDNEGAPLSPGFFEPGDTLRGEAAIAAGLNGAPIGQIVLHKFASGTGVSQAALNAEVADLEAVDAAQQTALSGLQASVTDLNVKDIYLSFTLDPIPDNTEVVKFAAGEAFSLNLIPSLQAVASTPPTGGSAVWDLLVNGAAFGAITFADGSTTGTYSGWTSQTFTQGDIFSIETDAQNGLAGVSLTLRPQEVA